MATIISDETSLLQPVSTEVQTASACYQSETRPHDAAEDPPAWTTLSKLLPERNTDYDHWWSLTGRHLAYMVDAAAYPIEKQYEALLFHYHWTVPCLGPRPPSSGVARWNSLLTVDGSPIEYSWKWNTPRPGSEPDIRFTMEPMSKYTGTALDPLNQRASLELLHQLSNRISSADVTWTDFFLSRFFDSDLTKYVEEQRKGAHLVSSISLAFEFVKKGLSIKTYFAPRKLGQVGLWPMSRWESTIRDLEPNNVALDNVKHFLDTSSEGKLLTPFMLAVDNVKPSASRMKLYFQSPRTCFDSVREIMTLGGRITGIDRQLDELSGLIKAVTTLPVDFPDDAEIPEDKTYKPSAVDNFADRQDLLAGYMYYFDIAPGATLPDIKFYTPVRRYARNDMDLAKGIVGWMEAHGRHEYTQRYMQMLEKIAQHRRLDEDHGLQTYISCLFKGNGELDITTYLAPEAFHRRRLDAKP